MKHYDFEKAIALINKHKDEISSASLGMHEDWFWTAETVWEDDEFKRPFPLNDHAMQRHNEFILRRKEGMSLSSAECRQFDDILVSGIYGSGWATPSLQLVFLDGTDKMFSCFIGEEEDPVEKIANVASNQAMILGCLSGPVQDRITQLSDQEDEHV